MVDSAILVRWNSNTVGSNPTSGSFMKKVECPVIVTDTTIHNKSIVRATLYLDHHMSKGGVSVECHSFDVVYPVADWNKERLIYALRKYADILEDS